MTLILGKGLQMTISYDPDGIPEFTTAMFKAAEDLSMHVVSVICTDGDDSVQINCICSFIPRSGDRLQLDDGKVCEVSRVYYKTSTGPTPDGTATIVMLVPTVYAIRLADGR